MRDCARPPGHQAGAAVLMALFVATLATLIVTGLFYRQFVLLRTIENQQLVSQSRQLLRGALDWGRAILREDANRSSYDALSEPWAQPLAETRLDQLGETGSIASLASIAGSMEDAQGRFNLHNLVNNGEDRRQGTGVAATPGVAAGAADADSRPDRRAHARVRGQRLRRPTTRRTNGSGEAERCAVAADAPARHPGCPGRRPGSGRPARALHRRAGRAHRPSM